MKNSMSTQEAIEILAYEADELRGLARDYEGDISRLYDRKHQAHLLATKALRDSVPMVLTKEQIRDRILTLGADKFQPLYIQFRDNAYKDAPRWRDCYNVNSLVGGVPSDSDYGKIFVFWSALPSDEQMNAVIWEDTEK